MKCNDIRELLSLYIDDMLEESLMEEVEKHLATCVSCKKEYTDIADMVNHLREIPEISLPASFEMRLKAALAEEKSKAAIIPIQHKKIVSWKNKWRIAGSIAAVFAVGVLSFGFYQDIIDVFPKHMSGNDQSSVEMQQYLDHEVANDSAAKSDSSRMPGTEEAALENNEEWNLQMEDAQNSALSASKEKQQSNLYSESKVQESQTELAEDIYGMNSITDTGEGSLDIAAMPESNNDSSVSRHYKVSFIKENENCKRSFPDNGLEKNTAAVQYYDHLIEEMLSGFDYQLIDSSYDTGKGEWRFTVFISRGEDGNTYNKEIVIIGKDGKIEVHHKDERMGL